MSIAEAYIAACSDELRALKPGNVHDFADGHRMTVAQFERSADVSAGPLTARGASAGRRILGAVEATIAAVGTNTNLGIILLCAPLAMAAESGVPTGQVLSALTVEDASLAFRAIALANPAGLGERPEHDVRAPARITLLEAMRAAAAHDRIAHAYATDFDDLHRIGLPALSRAPWRPPWLGTTAVYLAYLSAFPDGHLLRKHGEVIARSVMRAAGRALPALALPDPVPPLLTFDRDLKDKGLNPGTSADLTVATLFLDRLANILRGGPDNG